MKYKTEQENFWAGEFGDEYIGRNKGAKIIAANVALFSKILVRTHSVSSVIEFGANVGLNLLAISELLPGAKLSAVEINKKAVEQLERVGNVQVYPTSILKFQPDVARDFVLTKGVLIHINPDELPRVYELLYQTSRRYICIVEYYNPTPVSITYRGHVGKLFKRDFAGEIAEMYRDLEIIDYGFVYHGDANFAQDDATWFLLEKSKQ